MGPGGSICPFKNWKTTPLRPPNPASAIRPPSGLAKKQNTFFWGVWFGVCLFFCHDFSVLFVFCFNVFKFSYFFHGFCLFFERVLVFFSFSDVVLCSLHFS